MQQGNVVKIEKAIDNLMDELTKMMEVSPENPKVVLYHVITKLEQKVDELDLVI